MHPPFLKNLDSVPRWYFFSATVQDGMRRFGRDVFNRPWSEHWSCSQAGLRHRQNRELLAAWGARVTAGLSMFLHPHCRVQGHKNGCTGSDQRSPAPCLRVARGRCLGRSMRVGKKHTVLSAWCALPALDHFRAGNFPGQIQLFYEWSNTSSVLSNLHKLHASATAFV